MKYFVHESSYIDGHLLCFECRKDYICTEHGLKEKEVKH